MKASHRVLRRSRYVLCGLALLLGSSLVLSNGVLSEKSGEILYNGIRLPTGWPPRQPILSQEPMSIPYLASPPEVIPIDVGRQLLVDDFLIADTNLKRSFHRAEFHPDTPVVKPDKPWEMDVDALRPPNPTAMPFSDGIFFDPKDNLFKMWYRAGTSKLYRGGGASTCYATSKDGVHWEKPGLDVLSVETEGALGLTSKTNVVYPQEAECTSVWLDLDEKNPERRFKLWRAVKDRPWALSLHYSADGIHWTKEITRSGPMGGRSSVFWNPFRQVWVYNIRAILPDLGRVRFYWEVSDLAGPYWHRLFPENWCKPQTFSLDASLVKPLQDWPSGIPLLWVGKDRLDWKYPGPMLDDQPFPQLYHLDCVAYESVLIGLFSMLRGYPVGRHKVFKPEDIVVGFSRDGFHWDRPSRQPLIPMSDDPESWNYGNVESAGGCFLVVKDKLYFYVSGRGQKGKDGQLGVCSTGLATLRRDGFASMDAGALEANLTTRMVSFRGKYLFVNADVSKGELWAEVLDRDGKVIPGFSRTRCMPLRENGTLQAVRWNGVQDLSSLSGKPVKLRFHLRNGELYSFWVSPDRSGASQGYVAAGGPGFTGPTDTVGQAGLR